MAPRRVSRMNPADERMKAVGQLDYSAVAGLSPSSSARAITQQLVHDLLTMGDHTDSLFLVKRQMKISFDPFTSLNTILVMLTSGRQELNQRRAGE